ncbi:GNAT family N-acetyltransferase [Paraburkholderia sp. SIMBA_055]|jgi:GNAT superfamily N-acetyltransferase|uniref:GNAT family N-acetyltransferase n=1 Tax=Burkholderiaceae TaxID=119060 RepID=UPI00149466EB|nr:MULTISPECIES: GNAT family N-acetyltransferase [Burkholderiaceae]MDR6476335.1 GNAT superfamily N-acetyltransferase [Paraburkholderia graminis]
MNTPPDFKHLDSPDEWTQAFPVMQELRPHLQDAASFARQMRRQREEHYRLLAARDASGAVLGLAGYRLQTNTLYGRFLYVDDLVVTARQQRSGIGAGLLDQVRDIARRSDCAHLVLDTGLHMPFAQRFYFRNGLLAKGMHFVESLQTIHKEAAQ